MIFLIEYDRKKQRLIKFEKFKNDERMKAEKKRLQIELDLNQNKIDHEVVLLEADSKANLRRTHSRYFKTVLIPRSLLKQMAELKK